MRKAVLFRAALLASTLHFCAPGMALADDAVKPGVGKAKGAAAQVEEVTVTARKRAESASKTPVALTALSADQLKNAGVVNVVNLQNVVLDPWV